MDGVHRLIDRKTVFEGKVVRLYLDRVLLPNGVEAERELVRHWGAVGMVPLDQDGGIFLVRQYRHPAGKELLEIPAGKLMEGEEPLECARRELEEEIGYRAGSWTRLASFYTSPGFSDEVLYLFLAEELVPTQASPEADEFLEVLKVSLDEALELVASGEIEDSKSIVGIALACLYRRGVYRPGGGPGPSA